MLLNRNFGWYGVKVFWGFLVLMWTAVSVVGAMEAAEGLGSRAEGRWTALIAGDFEKAYAFETPAYRALYSFSQYRSIYGTGLRWQQARVVKVDRQAPEVAMVTLEVDYSFQVSGQGMMDQRKVITETWLWVDGQWWHQVQ